MARTDLKTNAYVNHYEEAVDEELSDRVPGIDSFSSYVNMVDCISYIDEFYEDEINFGTCKEQSKISDRSGHIQNESDRMTGGKDSETASELSEFLKEELFRAGINIRGYEDDEE